MTNEVTRNTISDINALTDVVHAMAGNLFMVTGQPFAHAIHGHGANITVLANSKGTLVSRTIGDTVGGVEAGDLSNASPFLVSLYLNSLNETIWFLQYLRGKTVGIPEYIAREIWRGPSAPDTALTALIVGIAAKTLSTATKKWEWPVDPAEYTPEQESSIFQAVRVAFDMPYLPNTMIVQVSRTIRHSRKMLAALALL